MKTAGRIMSEVRSKDGTRIGYDQTGDGPPVILVDGALCSRAMGPMEALAARLADRFTVIRYDRRVRGESGDILPYAVEREIEDLAALIDVAGGWAYVCGVSSGAALVLEAANRALPIRKVVLYEAPFIVDDTRPPLLDDYRDALTSLIAAGRRGDAVALFMRAVQVPAPFVMLMRFMPVFGKLKAVAHTLPYDFAIVADNQRGQPLAADRWASATLPILVGAGGKSPAWMRNAQQALASVLPNAELRTLPGQTHMISDKALAPLLIEFFSS
jgi:pimeloyl-ACP methyl ester carboxylesterase